MPHSLTLTVLFPNEGESLAGFEKRIGHSKGEILVILSQLEDVLLRDKDVLAQFLASLKASSSRIRLATRDIRIAEAARKRGFRVYDRVLDLKKLLQGHAHMDEALRAYSPQLWKQQLRSRLQSIGLLSLPRLRIWALIFISALLFLFVFFKLLPSATVRVWPREDTVSQTVNIFLVQSGAVTEIPDRVRSMQLVPLVAITDHTLTFDTISKQFVGTNAAVSMTIVNNSPDRVSLRKDTRLSNQAGMIFRIQEPIIIDPGEAVAVKAKADDVDLYGEIIGSRGNLPAGLKWEIPGLSEEERKLIYGENRSAATGGTTDYRTVLIQADLEVGKKKLEQELLAIGKQLVEEQKVLLNTQNKSHKFDILYYDELTKTEYFEEDLPDEFLGETVTSIPFTGKVRYTAYAYDTQHVLSLLSDELKAHIESGKRLQVDTMTLDKLVTHVIDYADDLSWIKITVDLSGNEEYILDPLSPTGAGFARKVRESITGKSIEDARRIIQNLPEVDKAEVKMWPPWNKTLPMIPTHISIEPQQST